MKVKRKFITGQEESQFSPQQARAMRFKANTLQKLLIIGQKERRRIYSNYNRLPTALRMQATKVALV
jgi:hypothetical protein